MAQSTQLVDSPYGQQAVAQMAATGLREARYPAPWYIADADGAADKPGGEYVWSTYFDSVATELAKNGMRWDPMFLYAPAIYSADPGGTSGGNPTRASYPYFASFVSAFAKRDGEGGSFWSENPQLAALPVTDYEIWNEPNIAGGWATPQTAPEDYMDLYAGAYGAIKGVDQSARVMFASLTPRSAPKRRIYRLTSKGARRSWGRLWSAKCGPSASGRYVLVCCRSSSGWPSPPSAATGRVLYRLTTVKVIVFGLDVFLAASVAVSVAW